MKMEKNVLNLQNKNDLVKRLKIPPELPVAKLVDSDEIKLPLVHIIE